MTGLPESDSWIAVVVSVVAVVALLPGPGAASGAGATETDFAISLDVPDGATAGEETTMSATVSTPDVPGEYEEDVTVRLFVDGERVAERTVTVGDGETTTVTFSPTFAESGTHTVEVEGEVTLAGRTYSNSASATVDVEGAAPDAEPVSETGAAFAVPESLQDDVEAYRGRTDGDVGAYAFVLATRDDLYLVFTDRQPTKGEATVDGLSIDGTIEQNGTSFDVVAAESVSFEQRGTPTTVADVADDPEGYAYDLVRIDAHHRSVAVLTDSDGDSDVAYSSTTGLLVAEPRDPSETFGNAGGRARDVVVNADGASVTGIVGSPPRPHLYTASFETSFWVDAPATVDGIVLSPNSAGREFVTAFDPDGVVHADADAPLLYLVQADYDSREVSDVESVTRRADSLDGEVVTVEARLYQQTISVEETLEENTDCGDEQVRVKEACAPVVHDTLLHAGAAWSSVPESRDDVLLVTGVSSREQDTPSEFREGRYRITGEVVSTDRINESLPDGVALVVYDMERVGDIDSAAVSDEGKRIIENRSAALGDRLRTQVTGEAAADGPASVREAVGTLEANETATVDVGAGGSAASVERINLSAAARAENVTVEVTAVDGLPSAVEQPPGSAVGVLDVAVSASNDEIDRARIELRVNRSAVPDGADLRVYRYHDGEWTPLESSVVDRTETAVVVEAETPGFSYFAVTANGTDGDATGGGTTAETTAEDGPEEGPDAAETSSEGLDGFTAVGALAALVVFVARRRGR